MSYSKLTNYSSNVPFGFNPATDLVALFRLDSNNDYIYWLPGSEVYHQF